MKERAKAPATVEKSELNNSLDVKWIDPLTSDRMKVTRIKMK
jgi:hypothetical protein